MILYSRAQIIEKPQTICQKLVMYLYGARMAHCGVWDYFLISGHQTFCRIRYCGRVWYVRVLIQNTNFANNEGIIGQIKTRCVRKGMWPLIAKHNTSRTNWMNKIEDNLTMKQVLIFQIKVITLVSNTKKYFGSSSHTLWNCIIWRELSSSVCTVQQVSTLYYTFIMYFISIMLHRNQQFSIVYMIFVFQYLLT